MSLPGRGRGLGLWRGRGAPRRPPSSLPTPPLGNVIVTIHYDEIESSKSGQDDTASRIRNSQYLTSYNWLGGEKSRIIVPGEPPKWTPLPDEPTLPQDRGEYYRDQNAARYPAHPLEPMVQAILKDKPEFPVANVDIIGCNNTMGNLLGFVLGQDKPFRMLVEVLGKTVFFVRRENSPTEIYPNSNGYGHTFPEAYTTWDAGVGGSQSHQRVMEYEFAGMQCLVRFEADGFLPDLFPDTEGTEGHPVTQDESADPEGALPSIEQVTISGVSSVTTAASNQLEIARQGRRIPQCAIFDLKTRARSKRNQKTLREELPRLWLTQTPNFILAHHTAGQFMHIRVQNVQGDVEKWEETQQPALGKFASLLQMIVVFARSLDNGKFEIEHKEGMDVLNLRKQGGVVNGVLSPAVASKWDM